VVPRYPGHVIDFTWPYEAVAIARLNVTNPYAVIGKRLLNLFPNIQGTRIFQAYVEVAESGNH
jgi:hypothetical protein